MNSYRQRYLFESMTTMCLVKSIHFSPQDDRNKEGLQSLFRPVNVLSNRNVFAICHLKYLCDIGDKAKPLHINKCEVKNSKTVY